MRIGNVEAVGHVARDAGQNKARIEFKIGEETRLWTPETARGVAAMPLSCVKATEQQL